MTARYDDLIARVEGGSEGEDKQALIRDICRLFNQRPDYPSISVQIAGVIYRGDLQAARAFVERVLPGWFWRVGHGSHAGPWAHLNRVHPDSCLPGDEATSYAPTPERALIAAALRALSGGGVAARALQKVAPTDIEAAGGQP